jgi:exosome complex component RRP4
MCGPGVAGEDLPGEAIISIVRGFVTRLLSVTPMAAIYHPKVGDIVIGRIAQVQQQRWEVQIGCSDLAVLRLSAIYLPDDQLRRRTTSDERSIRRYFDVGDLVCAEVREVPSSGPIALHTRQQHPRQLGRGVVIEVPPRLIKRVPTHICARDLDGSAFQIIWGINGSVWLSAAEMGGAALVPRIRNCIMLLATYEQQISTDALRWVFERTHERPANRIVTVEAARELGFVGV